MLSTEGKSPLINKSSRFNYWSTSVLLTGEAGATKGMKNVPNRQILEFFSVMKLKRNCGGRNSCVSAPQRRIFSRDMTNFNVKNCNVSCNFHALVSPLPRFLRHFRGQVTYKASSVVAIVWKRLMFGLKYSTVRGLCSSDVSMTLLFSDRS